MRILVKIASLQSQFVVLDEALKVTNRRVNALEFIQIPKILNIIAWIESELDEESREDFFRLKKVQDNKKRDKKKAAMATESPPTTARAPRVYGCMGLRTDEWCLSGTFSVDYGS